MSICGQLTIKKSGSDALKQIDLDYLVFYRSFTEYVCTSVYTQFAPKLTLHRLNYEPHFDNIVFCLYLFLSFPWNLVYTINVQGLARITTSHRMALLMGTQSLLVKKAVGPSRLLGLTKAKLPTQLCSRPKTKVVEITKRV